MLQLIIVGNLGADAVVKEANGKKFVSFNVAHTERWTDDQGVIHDTTQWVGCALSGDGGNLLQYLRKGTCIYAIGRVKTRVYSSEQARGFVAGLDLSIQHIELIGARPDDIPSRLYDKEGKQIDISKHYWTQMSNYYNTIVYDKGGKQYTIDKYGWVAAVKEEEQPTKTEETQEEQHAKTEETQEQQPAKTDVTQEEQPTKTEEAPKEDAPFEEGVDPLANKVSQSKNKKK